MTSNEIRKKYLAFFQARGHAVIPSSPIVPVNDPTTLFTSCGMQPLIPYLLGQPHPSGKRLVNSQKSFRAADIDEVGDTSHTTFFEMLGNWSLGDYFKKEQLPWFFEFLTKELELNPKRLYVSVFDGDKRMKAWRNNLAQPLTPDVETIAIWKQIFSEVGIDARDGYPTSPEGIRIFSYPASKNWWSRSGEPEKMPPGEPGGPDSEVFHDFGEELNLHDRSAYKNKPCHPNCQCGRFMEIGNSVFMQYQKQDDGSLIELPQKNVDFGGGLERLNAVVNGTPDIFKTDSFRGIINILENLMKKKYEEDSEIDRAMRIIADHLRGSVMMMTDGVLPSNKTQGYVLRRLIRRAILYAQPLGLGTDVSKLGDLVLPVAEIYKDAYPEVSKKAAEIKIIIKEEAVRFGKSLERGLREFEKLGEDQLNELNAFNLFQSFGFPYEITEELFRERGKILDKKKFEEVYENHQRLSRATAAKLFKGGLADHSEQTTKLHTAHHLMLAALQKMIDPSIRQRGSNITGERLRMDFNYSRKLTGDELSNIELFVNEKIKANVPVTIVGMDKGVAEKIGAQMEFGQKYPDRVSVHIIGLSGDVESEKAKPSDYVSAEFCGGPHVRFTGVLGHFTIKKEESAGAGIRRIYATLE
ncbi:alanine--tRNA ligase [Patescibacteria group bacterium]|nr:alanine--tRNA ligase [Patescibacteria group bacterium]MBU1472343.1 alanine--tRNA ligase [Patescibacteria group bacterium]MBU2460405.1 alanine--tRNA ligase [Patescibacteria group bacterium]MBU2544214.1 alanine--tRNA ligase [Patescibacteria group bacterium]